jgi:hypothetical protein
MAKNTTNAVRHPTITISNDPNGGYQLTSQQSPTVAKPKAVNNSLEINGVVALTNSSPRGAINKNKGVEHE